MNGVDLSEWQTPGSVSLAGVGFVVIRSSHGLAEDRHWREHYNNAVAAGVGHVGFYHFAEHNDPQAEARFFWGLTNGIPHDYGHWLDVETGQDEHWVDAFRAVYDTGVYSNVNGYTSSLHHVYDRFDRNWVAWLGPGGPPLAWLLWQQGQTTVDTDRGPDAPPGVDPNWAAFRWPHL